MSGKGKADPNDWARKRKEAIERAKQLREERKNGHADLDENYTFKPQVNKRPQYLGNGADGLDNVAGNSYAANPDDIFEQPLPGARHAHPRSDLPDHAAARGRGGEVLSPSGDSLGSEMKRYPVGHGGAGPGGGGGQFRSKFMQQYENADLNDPPPRQTRQTQPSKYPEYEPKPKAPSSFADQTQLQYHNDSGSQRGCDPPRHPQHHHPYEESEGGSVGTPADHEADSIFLSSLRGGNRSSGPAWNDDVTASPGIPPVPPLNGAGKTTTVSYRRRRTQGQSSVPPPPTLPARGGGRTPHRPEWNDDPSSGIPPVENSGTGTITSPSVAGGSGGAPSKSRLSLLKSKLRRSDSGSELRSLSAHHNPQQTTGPVRASSTGMSSGVSLESDFGPAGAASAPNSSYGMGKGVGRRNRADGGGGRSAAAEDDEMMMPGYEGGYGSTRGVAAAGRQRERDRNDGERSLTQQQHPPTHVPHRGGRRNTPHTDDDSMEHESSRSNTSSRGGSAGGQARGRPAAPLPSSSSKGGGVSPSYQTGEQRHRDRETMGGGSSPFEVEDISSGEQLECPDCGRKFNPIPYEKHVKICAKVFLQKRKAFDSKKMRIADNPELLKIQQAALRSEKKATAAAAAASKKKSDAAAASRRAEERAVGGTGGGNGGKWKEQSNQFREAMRMARMVAKAEKTGGPMPEMAPSAPDPSLVPCPNCGRTFNERAAERHIPQCKNIRAQPKSLKRGSGGAGGRAGTGAVNKAKQQTSGAGRW